MVPGYEAAGVVVAIGRSITEQDCKVGDRVFGFCNFGGYAGRQEEEKGKEREREREREREISFLFSLQHMHESTKMH
jgi:threonine dehydrogenase-like Zn-dependent dehydrogenase